MTTTLISGAVTTSMPFSRRRARDIERRIRNWLDTPAGPCDTVSLGSRGSRETACFSVVMNAGVIAASTISRRSRSFGSQSWPLDRLELRRRDARSGYVRH
jgi:hypothetical protein